MGRTPAVPGRKGSSDFVARVVSITFKSDHRDSAGAKLLRGAVSKPLTAKRKDGRIVTFSSQLSEEGATVLSKPDWSLNVKPTRNDPISQTMGTGVVADIEILFKKVPNGTAKLSRVVGTASQGALALTFNVGPDRTVKDGDVVTLTSIDSSGPLPSIVALLEESIRWSAVIDGRPPSPIGSTGPHKIFVTLDQPRGNATSFTLDEGGPAQLVTVPRMTLAVLGARGADTEKKVADNTFDAFKRRGIGYVLGFRTTAENDQNFTGMRPRPSVEHYLWLCTSNQGQGECHVIAAAFRLACRTVGVAGKMDVGFMMPHPGRQEHAPDFPRRIDGVKGRLNIPATRPAIHLVFMDGDGAANNFEGVIKFGNALYAIGDAVFDRNTAAVNGVSADDLNATDYFTDRPDTFPRSLPGNPDKGLFDLEFVTDSGGPPVVQYPWSTVTGAPAKKKGKDKAPFRWED